MENFSYLSAFLFGFFGSTHCIGMCGSIITIFSLDLLKAKKKHIFLYQIYYNLARIFSYGIIGLISGLLSFFLFDYLNFIHFKIIKILSSIMIIFLGMHLIFNFNLFVFLEKFSSKYIFILFNNLGKKILSFKSPLKELLLGLIWGNMPCGLVYGALGLSILSGSIYESFFLMIFFGLGTLPSLIIFSKAYLHLKFINKKKIYIKKFFGIIIVFFGFSKLLSFF